MAAGIRCRFRMEEVVAEVALGVVLVELRSLVLGLHWYSNRVEHLEFCDFIRSCKG